jgi:hypothetical protein
VTSKRRYFYVVRVQVLAPSAGLPVEFCIFPGGCTDLQGLAELALNLPVLAQLFLDAGYNFYEWEDYLLETNQLLVQVSRKSNSKRAGEPWLEISKSLLRKYIETTIGEISKLFPIKIHATNLNGFLLKIASFLFAYQLIKPLFNNWQLGLLAEDYYIDGFLIYRDLSYWGSHQMLKVKSRIHSIESHNTDLSHYPVTLQCLLRCFFRCFKALARAVELFVYFYNE